MFDRMFEHMTYLDWGIVAAYFVFAVLLAAYHSRRSTSGIENYFASGRGAAWWLLGTSMVATTFAADTPLVVSGLVVKYGIAQNWYWWSLAFAHLLGVFLFSRLWRRSRVLTDTELAEFRYGGKSAAILRGFRAIYFSTIYNCIIIGWVNLALVKVFVHVLGVDEAAVVATIKVGFINFDITMKVAILLVCFSFSAFYTTFAGLTGVMLTDLVQFVMAMFGSIYLSIVAVKGIGGLSVLGEKLIATYGAEKASEITSLFPSSSSSMFVPVMLFLLVQWWAAQNIDSGGYLAQRMLSAKNEKHSFLGMLWFSVSFYCLRPWPWIVVGLVAAVMFPYLPDAAGVLPDPEAGYVKVMLHFLPPGILGIMVASFLAAYMSTIDTHLNWGASYLINDFYKRFIVREGSERHYIAIAIVFTVLIAALGAVFTMFMSSIEQAWYIVSAIYGGLAIVYILRWYWWRINAWSEIGAIAGAFISTGVFRWLLPVKMGIVLKWQVGRFALDFSKHPDVLLLIVPAAFGFAMLLTFLTPPVEEKKLIAFYKRVRPGGLLWKKISSKIPGSENDPGPTRMLPGYVVSIIAVYSALFGVGKIILGAAPAGLALLGLSFVCGVILWKYIGAMKWIEDDGSS
ncbi:MAG: sodium:solute symporter family protein [bacterium]